MKKVTNLLILENDNWFWAGFEVFFKTISPNYEVFRPKVSDLWYVNNTALLLSMTLAQRNITDVAMQSAFETTSSVEVVKDSEELSRQIEVLMPVIREVLCFRKSFKLPKLTFHVVYNGDDFIEDMRKGNLGETTWSMFSLLMRQQNNVIVKTYNHETFELKNIYIAPYEF